MPLFKRKGDIQECNNYRGIKLETVVNERLTECNIKQESHFGHMPGQSTTDAIFELKKRVEKHREGQKDFHLVFTNIDKTYDHISGDEVWRCARQHDVPEKYMTGYRICPENVKQGWSIIITRVQSPHPC